MRHFLQRIMWAFFPFKKMTHIVGTDPEQVTAKGSPATECKPFASLIN